MLDAAVVGRMRLTTREAGVQHHVGAGLAADAVADLLRISTRTVCSASRMSTGSWTATTRLAAVRRAQGLGLLPPSEPRA